MARWCSRRSADASRSAPADAMLRGVAVVAALLLFPVSTRAEGKPTPAGCFFYGWRFTTEDAISIPGIQDAKACQALCAYRKDCNYFGYRVDHYGCFLGSDAVEEVHADTNMISGPKECPATSKMCSVLPGPDFPGENAKQSNAAWETGMVPPNLQCWPRDSDGRLSPCNEEPLTTLDSWPERDATCDGLQEVSLADPDGQCQHHCEQNVSCPGWEITQEDGEAHCREGVGFGCRVSEEKRSSIAKRHLRGHYRVLMGLKGYYVLNLRPIFEAGLFTWNAVSLCNHTCLSLLSCQAWQYSTKEGCAVHDPSFARIQYPPTMDSIITGTTESEAVVAGQYIQRLCTGDDDPTDGAAGPLSKPRAEGVVPAVLGDAAADRGGGGADQPPLGMAANESAPFANVPTTTNARTTTNTAPSEESTTHSTSTAEEDNPTTTTSDTEAIDESIPTRNRFIRVGNDTYFEDIHTHTKHVVRNSRGCESCPQPAHCDETVRVGLEYVNALTTAEDFECQMLEESEDDAANASVPPPVPPQAPPAEAEGGSSWFSSNWKWLLLAALVLFICCAILLCCRGSSTSVVGCEDEDDSDDESESVNHGRGYAGAGNPRGGYQAAGAAPFLQQNGDPRYGTPVRPEPGRSDPRWNGDYGAASPGHPGQGGPMYGGGGPQAASPGNQGPNPMYGAGQQGPYGRSPGPADNMMNSPMPGAGQQGAYGGMSPGPADNMMQSPMPGMGGQQGAYGRSPGPADNMMHSPMPGAGQQGVHGRSPGPADQMMQGAMPGAGQQGPYGRSPGPADNMMHSPMPGMGGQQEMDLVTITPQGYRITPMPYGQGTPPGGASPIPMQGPMMANSPPRSPSMMATPPPPGGAFMSPERRLAPGRTPSQDMDLVTITPQGLQVTPVPQGQMPGMPVLGALPTQ